MAGQSAKAKGKDSTKIVEISKAINNIIELLGGVFRMSNRGEGRAGGRKAKRGDGRHGER